MTLLEKKTRNSWKSLLCNGCDAFVSEISQTFQKWLNTHYGNKICKKYTISSKYTQNTYQQQQLWKHRKEHEIYTHKRNNRDLNRSEESEIYKSVNQQ